MKPTHKIRFLAFSLGIILLFWLPFEETGVQSLLLFGSLICTLGAVAWWVQRGGHRLRSGLSWMLTGALIGVGIPAVALFLAAFKTGLHAHGVSEITPAQTIFLLWSLPIGFLLGFMAGLGSWLLFQTKLKSPERSDPT